MTWVLVIALLVVAVIIGYNPLSHINIHEHREDQEDD